MSREIRAVHLPVRSALLTEDRGLIHREGTFSWPGGAGVVKVEGLSPLLVDATLQPAFPAGRVGRVSINRRWKTVSGRQRSDWELAQAAWRHQEALASCEERLQRAKRQQARLEAGLARYAERLSAAVSAGIDADAAGWARAIEQQRERLFAQLQQEAALAAEHAALAEAMGELHGASALAGKEWRLAGEVEIALEAPEGDVALSLRYLVPSALWRPTYEARLDAAGARVSFAIQATIWQRTGEDWAGAALTLSTARPSVGAALPPLHHDALALRDKTAEERKTIQASFRDQAQAKASLAAGSSGLPGVDDGGETRTLAVPDPATIPSDGRPHRLAVGGFETAAALRHVCIPELKPLVFSSVELDNAAPHPLLAGPVILLRAGGAAGLGEIPFVAPGERFTLSFGSQDDVVVRYRRHPEIEERTLASDRRWLWQTADLTHTGASPLTIELLLRIPVSEIPEVAVVLDREKRTSPGSSGPDAQGHLRWTIDLKPGETATRSAAFRLEKGGSVRLDDPW